MPNYKFRASYTTLSAWATGNWERAVKMYFKLEQFTTRAMAEGKAYHEQWESEVNETNKLPQVFGAKPLGFFKTELKICKQLDSWLELVGKIDLQYVEDEQLVLVDYKTGNADSNASIGGMQLPVYKLLIPDATKGEIYHYNQYNKKVTVSYRYLTEKTFDEALNWLLTNASEMHNYLMDNNLYNQYGS